MASILPFRGLRYNVTTPLDLALVTAPPYDCISAQEYSDLLSVHPYNVVRLILESAPGNAGNHGAGHYAEVARRLSTWTEAGVLVRERKPALYLYEQEFTFHGRTAIRRGFVARVALEELGQGSIFPHEQTFAGPKADRLALLKASRCNMSQVLSLYEDEGNEVMGTFDRLSLGKADLIVVDNAGIVNRMWIVTDETIAGEISELMYRRPLFIADGHHRYATALAYRQWLAEQGENVSEHHPANTTSMMCVSMSDPGVAILPTHRVLTRVPNVTAEEIREALAPHFTWKEFSGAEATSGRMEDHLPKNDHIAFGIYVRGDQAGYVATLKDLAAMACLATDHSDQWRRLDVAVLHRLVLGKLLVDKLGDPEAMGIRYFARAGEAFDAVHEDGAALAFLMRPTRMDQFRALAGNGELLPHKSTYFYPKLLSGMVMNPLD
jgi:uncharacterized protein (DUF1015 family)